MIGKPKAPAELYRVPSLAEADPDVYGALVAKRAELQQALAAKQREARALEKEIAADTSREVRPAVAELLGDGPSSKALKRGQLADRKHEVADIESALTMIEARIRDAKTAALRKVVALVRPEFDRRMTALCQALKAADAAHRELDELRLDLEAEDVSTAHLGPTPHFLGDAGSGRIASFLKEAGGHAG